MGKVVVTVRAENFADLVEVQSGHRAPLDVRAIVIDDALVDTGATMLGLPSRYVERLGLPARRTRNMRTTAGVRQCSLVGPVQLTIQGRDCVVEVAEIPDDCSVLIGQIPLEALDFVVDPVGQRLVGNSAHGGEHMIDMFLADFALHKCAVQPVTR